MSSIQPHSHAHARRSRRSRPSTDESRIADRIFKRVVEHNNSLYRSIGMPELVSRVGRDGKVRTGLGRGSGAQARRGVVHLAAQNTQPPQASPAATTQQQPDPTSVLPPGQPTAPAASTAPSPPEAPAGATSPTPAGTTAPATAQAGELAPPQLSGAKQLDGSSFMLQWQPIPGAVAYGVYSNGQLIGHTQDPAFAARIADASKPLQLQFDSVDQAGKRSPRTAPLTVGVKAAAPADASAPSAQATAPGEAPAPTAPAAS